MDYEPILVCTNLTKVYAHIEALSGVNLTLPRGRIIGLLGPNGSGKTTLIKIVAGLLTATAGEARIAGNLPGVETKRMVSYLPERSYLSDWMKVSDALDFFSDFYDNFNRPKALEMLGRMNITIEQRLKTMSKGTREKVQLALVMGRDADLYLLDEPIGGVDPAARDFILDTIIGGYRENSTVLLSTHLIYDIEKVLEDVVFLNYGRVALQASVDSIREEQGKSVDELFREVFRC